MTHILRWGLVLGLVLAASAASAADVSGKWTWTRMIQDNEVTFTMAAKQEGEKLTGTVTRTGADTKSELKEGTVKGSDIAFHLIIERNGQQFKSVYKGKLDGEMIKGTVVTNFGGQERMSEWVAKKAK